MRILYIFLLAVPLCYCQQPSHYLNQALQFQQQEQYSSAIQAYTHYLAADPHNASVQAHYAYCCIMIGNIPEALNAYRSILRENPRHEQTLYNIAYALKTAGLMQESLQFYNTVLTINPQHTQALFGKARTLISMGDFSQGWPLYRTHLEQSNKQVTALHTMIAHRQLHNKIVVLIPEGSFGDTIQFIRYADTLKNMGATVIAMVQKQLIPLLSRCPFIDTLLSTQDPVPTHHAMATLMNMPALCDSDDQSIPRTIPYLVPDPNLLKKWGSYLAHDSAYKIGICWQADVHNDVSRPPIGRRGIPLSYLYPLSDIPGVSLYSLQQYDGLEQLENLPTTFKLHLFNNSFDKQHGAFMDTAAVMAHLDLVITVDTSIAHLAGALGIPTFLMLPYQTDWRWITDRTDTPWYPSMRIFKQQKPFDYAGVTHVIIEAVKHRIFN